MKKQIIFIVISLGLLVTIFYLYTVNNQKEMQRVDNEIKAFLSEQRILNEDNEIDKDEPEDILQESVVSQENILFENKINLKSWEEGDVEVGILQPMSEVNCKMSNEQILKLENSNNVMQFHIRSNTKCQKVNVMFTDDKDEIIYSKNMFVNKQWLYVSIPNENINFTNIVIANKGDEEVYIGDFIIATVDKIEDVKRGTFVEETYEKVYLDENGIGVGKSEDVICKGDYLYILQKESIVIVDKITFEKVSEISNIYEGRHIIYNEKHNMIIVTARENGAYFIDISNIYSPQIVSHFDTLELVTGVDSYGDYVFLCSRYFGIEVVNIEKPDEPKVMQTIRNNIEYEDCKFWNGFLYVGAWAQQCVDIYKLNAEGCFEFQSTINVDGRAYGLDVKDNMLYVATGHHSTDLHNDELDAGYGAGNGFEIYNVEDPMMPIWISTVKMDGTFYCGNYDVWKIHAFNNYVIVSNSFNGIFIYDVSDLYNPTLKKQIQSLVKDTTKYNGIFTYKGTLKQEPLCCFDFEDGKLYIAGKTKDTYVYDLNQYGITDQRTADDVEVVVAKEKYEISDTNIEQYFLEDKVYAVVDYDGYILGATSSGIEILTTELEYIGRYGTQSAVRDIKVQNGYIYTAESESGIGIYKIQDDKIVKCSNYNDENNKNMMSVSISPNNCYVTAQSGTKAIYIIDVMDKEKPSLYKRIENIWGMYYRSISSSYVDNRYLCFSGFGNTIWYDYGVEQEQTKPKELKCEVDINLSESRGYTAYKNYALAIYGGGYVIYDPQSTENIYLNELEIYKAQESIIGKAQVFGDLLVVLNEADGVIYMIDIQDITKPNIIQKYQFIGNPDFGTIVNNAIYIPLKNAGVAKINL